jgi:hypothetical protein
MYEQNLELLRLTRAATLRLCAGVSQAQSEFVPGAGKWSVGEVLDHLLLAERFHRGIFVRLIDLQKSGRRPTISLGFNDVNTSIAHLPRSLMPMLDVPFTIFNMFVPRVVRETMTQFRILSAQSGDIGVPQKGKPVRELQDALSASYEDTAAVFRKNPQLDYRELRYTHPLLGGNDVLESLRIVALHERRHQSQIQDILQSRQFPKVA